MHVTSLGQGPLARACVVSPPNWLWLVCAELSLGRSHITTLKFCVALVSTVLRMSRSSLMPFTMFLEEASKSGIIAN